MTQPYPRCPDCGGTVRLMTGPGRTREVLKGVHVEIPVDFEVPACEKCGEPSMNIEVSEPLDFLLLEHVRAKLVLWMESLKPELGTPGVRDPDAPCEGFDPNKSTRNLLLRGTCDTDGHYLCHECIHRAEPEEPWT